MTEQSDGLDRLHFIGKVLLVCGSLSAVIMTYRAFSGLSYDILLTGLTLLSGILLVREHVRFSHILCWISGFFLVIALALLIAFPIFVPHGLIVALAKHEPLWLIKMTLPSLLPIVILAWLFFILLTAPVKALWEAKGIRYKSFFGRPLMGLSFGFSFGFMLLYLSYYMQNSADVIVAKKELVSVVKKQVKGDYQFWVSGFSYQGNVGRDVMATVFVYNKNEVKTIDVMAPSAVAKEGIHE